MTKPLVSVYCLAYNHEKYIRYALEGFVNQKTDFNYEVYVHDDASTDNTASIIKEYEQKYPHIIKAIYQKENQYSKGVHITNQFILPKLKGKYIAVCEGDDYWIDENKIQLQVNFLENNKDYVACVHNTIGENATTGEKNTLYSNINKDLTFNDVVQYGGQSYQLSSLMCRREYFFNKPDFFDKAGSVGDYPLAIYLSLNGKIKYFNKPMSVYRIMTENSWTKRNASKDKQVVVYQNTISMLKAVNVYSQYKHDKLINKIILQNEYKIDEITHNFRQLRNKKYKKIWSDRSFIFRLKRKAYVYFGNFIVFLKKRLGKNE